MAIYTLYTQGLRFVESTPKYGSIGAPVIRYGPGHDIQASRL